MGRILEILNDAESILRHAPESALTLPSAAHELEPVSEEEPTGPVSFIEVGGPRKLIEASPDVLACSPPPGVRAAPTPVAVPRSSSGLKSVSFRPLSSEPLPLPSAQGRFAPDLVAFHQPEHALSEGYRSLCSRLLTQRPPGTSHVAMFTALVPKSGATTVLLNLALTAARQGEDRVIVVDANRHHPDVARRLGLPPSPGLREVLLGSLSLPQVLLETGMSNFQALTAGKPDENGTVRLVMEAMPMVLRLLREQFSLILIDAPSWDAGADAARLASTCDAAYLVVEQSQAESPQVAEILQTLRHEGAALCGCILTQW